MSSVKYWIKHLQTLPQDDEIILGYWDKEYFDDSTQPPLTTEQWGNVVDMSDGLDWSDTNEAIDCLVAIALEEEV